MNVRKYTHASRSWLTLRAYACIYWRGAGFRMCTSHYAAQWLGHHNYEITLFCYVHICMYMYSTRQMQGINQTFVTNAFSGQSKRGSRVKKTRLANAFRLCTGKTDLEACTLANSRICRECVIIIRGACFERAYRLSGCGLQTSCFRN